MATRDKERNAADLALASDETEEIVPTAPQHWTESDADENDPTAPTETDGVSCGTSIIVRQYV